MNWVTLLCITGLLLFGFLWKRASYIDVHYTNALAGVPASAKSAWAMLWVLCLMLLVSQLIFSSKEKSNINTLSKIIPIYPNSEFSMLPPSTPNAEHLIYDTDDPPEKVIAYYLNSANLGEWVIKSKMGDIGIILTKGTNRELSIMAIAAVGWTPKKPYQITYVLKRQVKNR